MFDFLTQALETDWGPWAFLIFGSLLLWGGAEALVRGAAGLARDFGLSPMIIGVTIVAFGTSAPEWVVSITAALDDKPGAALGNIIGSNITNIALVLGLTATVLPLVVRESVYRREVPLVLLAESLFFLVAWLGGISRLDGALLLITFAALYFYLIRDALRSRESLIAETEDLTELLKPQKKGWLIGLTFLGLGGLTAGAQVFVGGAEVIGIRAGLSHEEVGLLILAFGTSLPELITSVVAALRKEVDISLGNLLGSNFFNILFVGGTLGILRPFQIDSLQFYYHMPIMIFVTVLIFPLVWHGKHRLMLQRSGGIILVCCHVLWIGGTIWLRGRG